jgi:hypothetical protein
MQNDNLEKEGYIKDRFNYSTILVVKDEHWKLQFEFVKGETGEWEQMPDYWITECDLLEYHKAFATIHRLFRTPLIGDWILTHNGMVKIVERTFDVKEKILTITVV